MYGLHDMSYDIYYDDDFHDDRNRFDSEYRDNIDNIEKLIRSTVTRFKNDSKKGDFVTISIYRDEHSTNSDNDSLNISGHVTRDNV